MRYRTGPPLGKGDRADAAVYRSPVSPKWLQRDLQSSAWTSSSHSRWASMMRCASRRLRRRAVARRGRPCSRASAARSEASSSSRSFLSALRLASNSPRSAYSPPSRRTTGSLWMRGKRRRGRQPLAQRLPAVVGERVVRAAVGPARLRGRAQVAGLRELLGLGVVLALGRGPVDAAVAHHPHQVVRSRAALPHQGQDHVRERCEFRA